MQGLKQVWTSQMETCQSQKDPFLKAIPRMRAGRCEGKPRDGNWGLG